MPRDECQNLESWTRNCVFLGYKLGERFGYKLWDSKTGQVVRSTDVFFNESNMHMVAKRSIELRIVMFVDATPPTDGPAMHTRVALWFAASTATSTAMTGTSLDEDPVGHASGSTATLATNDEPASPVLG
mgnify:CR=1 FL=1